MKYYCTQCGYTKVVANKLAGKTFRCPKCHADNRIEPPLWTDAARTIESTVTSPLNPTLETPPGGLAAYDVVRGPLGRATVAYKCLKCNERLTSSLNDAGGRDNCPACGTSFVVPGEAEYDAEDLERARIEDVRIAQQEERTDANRRAIVNRVAQQNRKNRNVQLNRDPLWEWLVYVIVMGSVTAVAAGRYMVSAIVHDSSHLCIVIFALFFLGLTINFREILRLRNEYVCAAVCMINLRKPNGFNEVTDGRAAGILHQHVIDLWNIAQFDEGFAQDSLITLLYSRMMGPSKMVDIISGVLVTLGLVGTIVGLINMTDGLSITLTSLGADGRATDLLSGMRSTMTGLGTAFYTTLIGAILGSVVLRILNNVYISNADQLVIYVAATAEVSIVPRLKRRAKRIGNENFK